MFENGTPVSPDTAPPDDPIGMRAPDEPTDWAHVRARLGLSVIAVLLVAVTGGILTMGVRTYLTAVGNPTPLSMPTTAALVKQPTPPRAEMITVHTAGIALAERSGPSTATPVRGHLPAGATVGVICQIYGAPVTGPTTASPWWEVDAHGLYVADADITWASARPAMPWCGVTTHRAVIATAHVGADGLSLRSGPSTTAGKVDTDANGTMLTVACQIWGRTVDGVEGSTATWSKLTTGAYVSDAFVHWAPEKPVIPWCGETPRALPPANAAAFIKTAIAPAQASAAHYGIPASVTLAQAILESGSGASTLTQIDHNLFGMKCFGNPGSVAIGCRSYATKECNPNDTCYATGASFRAYRAAADSYADHGVLLSTTARYRPALAYIYDPDRFAEALQTAGYATSPKYATNLISVMKRYNLYQYDLLLKPVCGHLHAAATTPGDGSTC